MKWNYPSKGQLPEKCVGWCLVKAKNGKFYIATYFPEKYEWRCQDTSKWHDDPSKYGDPRIENSQVLGWIEIDAIKDNIQLDKNGEEYPSLRYENCKLEIADYSQDDENFTFSFGGRVTATCIDPKRTQQLMNYMRDKTSIDITIENGIIKDATPHEN